MYADTTKHAMQIRLQDVVYCFKLNGYDNYSKNEKKYHTFQCGIEAVRKISYNEKHYAGSAGN